MTDDKKRVVRPRALLVNWCVVCPWVAPCVLGLSAKFSLYEDISPRRSLGSIHKSLFFLLASEQYTVTLELPVLPPTVVLLCVGCCVRRVESKLFVSGYVSERRCRLGQNVCDGLLENDFDEIRPRSPETPPLPPTRYSIGLEISTVLNLDGKQ